MYSPIFGTRKGDYLKKNSKNNCNPVPSVTTDHHVVILILNSNHIEDRTIQDCKQRFRCKNPSQKGSFRTTIRGCRDKYLILNHPTLTSSFSVVYVEPA